LQKRGGRPSVFAGKADINDLSQHNSLPRLPVRYNDDKKRETPPSVKALRFHQPVELMNKIFDIVGHTGELRGDGGGFLGTGCIALDNSVHIIDGFFNFRNSLSLFLRRFRDDLEMLDELFRCFDDLSAKELYINA